MQEEREGGKQVGRLRHKSTTLRQIDKVTKARHPGRKRKAQKQDTRLVRHKSKAGRHATRTGRHKTGVNTYIQKSEGWLT